MPARPRPLRPDLSPRHLFGHLLRTHREAAGLSQRQLGEMVYCSGHLVGRMEKAERWPHPELVARCDEVLNAGGALTALVPELEGQRQAPADLRRDAPEERTLNALRASGTVAVAVQVDGAEIVMQVDRRALLTAGLVALAETFGLDPMANEPAELEHGDGLVTSLTLSSPAHLDEVLVHLRDQWHALVKTDNLLGPQYAVAGVLQQLAVVDGLLRATRADTRLAVLRVGAQYAESAAWLYEDLANLALAGVWTDRAMRWATEANDLPMTVWTMYRRSQQATRSRDAAEAIGLAAAARRNEKHLPQAMRAAIRVQEATGYSLDHEDHSAQSSFDEAHTWASSDDDGDAQAGHGSFCTPAYIELKRAEAWGTMGQPRKAIAGFAEWLPHLPTVYQRDRAYALTQQAQAHLADRDPEAAAATAHQALPIARSCGSRRVLRQINRIGSTLDTHRRLPAVATFIGDLHGKGIGVDTFTRD